MNSTEKNQCLCFLSIVTTFGKEQKRLYFRFAILLGRVQERDKWRVKEKGGREGERGKRETEADGETATETERTSCLRSHSNTDTDPKTILDFELLTLQPYC